MNKENLVLKIYTYYNSIMVPIWFELGTYVPAPKY